MACYKPLKAFRTPSGVVFSELARHDILGDIELPCGMCIGCRADRATGWTLRCMHEASMWPTSCCVTLTYARDKLPVDGSLDHRHFQLFMKRLRYYFPARVIRYFMCGEYGGKNGRPHYHANLFNVDFLSDWKPAGKSSAGFVFYESELLNSIWQYGRASVQPLTVETAGYVTRYIMKKKLGKGSECAVVNEHGVVLKPEYCAMSLRDGIGSAWLDKFYRDVYNGDAVVDGGGRKNKPPKFYDRYVRRRLKDAVDIEAIEFARHQRARLTLADSTPERLAVREVVHEARDRNKLRGLES